MVSGCPLQDPGQRLQSWPFSSWPGSSPAQQGHGAFAICNPRVTIVCPDVWLRGYMLVFSFPIWRIFLFDTHIFPISSFLSSFFLFCYFTLYSSFTFLYRRISWYLWFLFRADKVIILPQIWETACCIFSYLSVIWFFFLNIICYSIWSLFRWMHDIVQTITQFSNTTYWAIHFPFDLREMNCSTTFWILKCS